MGIIIVIIAAVLLSALIAGGWVLYSKRRLRESFGPEYETVAQEHDTKRETDRELLRRKRVHDGLHLRTISADEQKHYAISWQHVQGEFLDDPAHALNTAGQLVSQLLDARGYPGEDPNEQLALLSVSHAEALTDYRRAQRINEHARGASASTPTEEIRQALLSYHAMFNELLAEPGAAAVR